MVNQFPNHHFKYCLTIYDLISPTLFHLSIIFAMTVKQLHTALKYFNVYFTNKRTDITNNDISKINCYHPISLESIRRFKTKRSKIINNHLFITPQDLLNGVKYLSLLFLIDHHALAAIPVPWWAAHESSAVFAVVFLPGQDADSQHFVVPQHHPLNCTIEQYPLIR